MRLPILREGWLKTEGDEIIKKRKTPKREDKNFIPTFKK
jgi:hypothetical protein